MGCTIGGSPGKRVYYLRCRHREAEREGCSRPGVLLQTATAHLLTRLERSQLEQLIAVCQENNEHHNCHALVDAAQQRCDELQLQHQNTVKAYKAAARSGVDLTAALQVQCEVETELRQAKQLLADAQQHLDQQDVGSSASEALEPVLELQRAFAIGQDTSEQRRSVNLAMRRMGLVITLDTGTNQMGLAIADAPMQWQLIRALDRSALYWGDRIEDQAGLLVAGSESDFSAELRRSNRGEIS
jgi:hypothetical protein